MNNTYISHILKNQTALTFFNSIPWIGGPSNKLPQSLNKHPFPLLLVSTLVLTRASACFTWVIIKYRKVQKSLQMEICY